MGKIKEVVQEALGIPVLEELDTLTPPCITVDVYADIPAVVGNGKTEKTSYAVQLTLWTENKAEMKRLKEKLRQTIEEYFTVPQIGNGVDTDTRLYRTVFEFQSLEGE